MLDSMKEEPPEIPAWRRRLIKAIRDSGRSYRSISLACGLGHGYIQSLVEENKEPGVETVLAICAELGISATSVFTGVAMTASTEEVLHRFSVLSESQRNAFLDFLRASGPTTDGSD